jgi:hypothetical protein
MEKYLQRFLRQGDPRGFAHGELDLRTLVERVVRCSREIARSIVLPGSAPATRASAERMAYRFVAADCAARPCARSSINTESKRQ